MSNKFYSVIIVIILVFGFENTFAQSKSSTNFKNLEKDCKAFVNGKLLNNPKPIYPNEAKVERISGKVDVAVEIDEKGKVIGIESIEGSDLLKKAASEAALQAEFSLSICDGKPAKTVGIISFNFTPIPLQSEFFKPLRIEDLLDIKSEDKYYETLLFLTENYQIAFGYADQKYHAEMPLTKADFVHFLRQTLEMLDARSEIAKKKPSNIQLYKEFNPNNLQEIEFNPNNPSAESLKILSQKYKIIVADANGNFAEESALTQKNINEIWSGIFGEEAIPVNFTSEIEADKEMTRGDFALYLKESLEVLTYKLLP